MIDFKTEYWSFSISFYNREGMKTALLEAQDRFGADINLILLFMLLDTKQISLTTDDLKKLYNISDKWQRTVLQPFRIKRRAAKGTKSYEQLKKEELDLEIKAQAEMVSDLTAITGKDHLTLDYFQLLGVSNTLKDKLLARQQYH